MSFYVSVEDHGGGRHVLALGPFNTHGAALERVDEVRRWVCDHFREGHWCGFGTARHRNGRPAGKFNDELGYDGPGGRP